MKKRIKTFIFVMMLICTVGFIPSIKSEAASYVASDHNNMTGNGSAKVGSYSVKTQGTRLYSRKSNGKWKCIDNGSGGEVNAYFTTNGKTIYYSITKNNTDSAIYSINVSGKNKKCIKKIDSYAINVQYCYNGKLFYSADNGIDGLSFSTYAYSLKNGKTKKIVNGLRPINGKKEYVLLQSISHEEPRTYLFVYNARSGKLKKISSKSSSVKIFGNRIFYSEDISKKGSAYYTKRILSCKLNGTGKKKVSKAFKNEYIYSMNSKYVVFEKDGKKYKLTYKNNKITAVK